MERKNKENTFEWDDDDFLLPIPTPLLDLTEGVDKHARINDDDIGFFSTRLLGILGAAPSRGGRTHPLLVLVLLLMRVRSGDPNTTDGKLTALRIGGRWRVWALAIPPIIVVVAVVVARGRRTRGGSRDGLFELLYLVGEECGTERAGHCDFVRGCGLEIYG